MTDRISLDDMTSDQLDQLYDELDYARQLTGEQGQALAQATAAREEQRRRADQVEELLAIAHDTSNKSEAARARAEAVLREVLDLFTPAATLKANGTVLAYSADEVVDAHRLNRWRAAIDQPAPAAATPAADEPPLAIPHDMATTLHRTLGQLLGNQDAQAIARLRKLHHDEYGACDWCSTNDRHVPYPCPTIRVLDGEQPDT